MILKYNVNIDEKIFVEYLEKMINSIFKLLPVREEGGDWQPQLSQIITELVGFSRLYTSPDFNSLSLLSKLESLFTLTEKDDFIVFRRTIFECLNILSKVKPTCQDMKK